MKWCAPLPADPPGLALFRLQYPQETDWNRFRQDRTAYSELADALSARQRGLCAFCEAPLFTELPRPARQVEHWRPKWNGGHPSPAITFGIDNLHASCLGGTINHLPPPFGPAGLAKADHVSCGQKKDSIDPNGFPPAERPYRPTELPLSPPIFTLQFDGGLEINPDAIKAGLSGDRIVATIDYLGLNCDRLKFSRLRVRQYLNDMLAEYEAEATDEDPLDATRSALLRLASELSLKPGQALTAFVSVLRDFFGPAYDTVFLPDPNWAVK